MRKVCTVGSKNPILLGNTLILLDALHNTVVPIWDGRRRGGGGGELTAIHTGWSWLELGHYSYGTKTNSSQDTVTDGILLLNKIFQRQKYSLYILLLHLSHR